MIGTSVSEDPYNLYLFGSVAHVSLAPLLDMVFHYSYRNPILDMGKQKCLFTLNEETYKLKPALLYSKKRKEKKTKKSQWIA